MASVSFHIEPDSSSTFARVSLIKKEYKEFLANWDFVLDQFGGPEALFSGTTASKLFLLGEPLDINCDDVASPPFVGVARFFSSDVGSESGKPGKEVSFGVGSFDEEFYEELWKLFKKGGMKDVVAWSVVIWSTSIVGQQSWSGFVSLTRKGLQWSLDELRENESAPFGKNVVLADDEGPDAELLAIIQQLEAGDEADAEHTPTAKKTRAKRAKRE